MAKQKQTNHTLDFKKDRLLQIATVVFILMLGAFVYNKILPWQIEAVIIVTAAVGVLLIGFNRLPKSLQITGVVVMLIGTLGLFYSQSALNRAFRQIDVERSIVSFVVLEESEIQDLENGEDYRYGYSNMLDLELYENALMAVEEEFEFTPNTTPFNYDEDVYQALLNDQIDVMIVDNALVSLFIEEYPEFWERVRVVYEVAKDYEREQIRTETDFKTDPFVIYISGIDIEGPLSNRSRSDVNILMYVNPDKGEILQVSLPRDLYVPIACQNNVKDKLTHSGIYGVGCSINTIENFMGHQIDLFARVNFTSFMNIINVVGDIQVYSHYSFTTRNGQHSFNAGTNTMNAEQALAFSRERYNVPGGDVTRGLHQQEVIKGVIKKLVSPSTIVRIEGIISEVAKSVDTNATSDDLLAIVNRQIRDNIDWTFTSFAMEGTGMMLPGVQNPNQQVYYMQPNPQRYNEIQAEIKRVMNND